MAALKIDMTIPLGAAGHVRFTADIHDLDDLTDQQRSVLANTGREFYEFAASTLDPFVPAAADPPRIHDPSADVLRGVTGTRRNTS